MGDLQIDRLSLHVAGLSEAEGRRLALQVAEGLGAAPDTGTVRDIPTLRLDLTAAPGAGADELARQIVAEVLRQLRRLP
jgi:hypothetical protein